MADATSAFDRPPSPPPPAGDWGQAFAALPQASPTADVWPELAERVQRADRHRVRDARRRGMRRGGFALAATIACVAAGLSLWSMRPNPALEAPAGATQLVTDVEPARADSTVPAASAALSTASDVPDASPDSSAANAPRSAAVVASATREDAQPQTTPQRDSDLQHDDRAATRHATAEARRTPLPGPRRGERPRRPAPMRAPAADVLSLPVERRFADSRRPHSPAVATGAAADDARDSGAAAVPDHLAMEDATARDADIDVAMSTGTDAASDAARPAALALAPAVPSAAEGSSADDALPQLQARSAQLEAWLALLRDTSVGTGPAALITADFDDRLAGIDAALATVSDAEADVQRALWRARVSLLRRALAFESDLRALAAEGRDYDGALVAVD